MKRKAQAQGSRGLREELLVRCRSSHSDASTPRAKKLQLWCTAAFILFAVVLLCTRRLLMELHLGREPADTPESVAVCGICKLQFSR
jgi:hypothetical protein